MINISFAKANISNILIITFLGIALILAIIYGLESMATTIVGAFVGYIAKTIQNKMTNKTINKRSDVKWVQY